MKEERDGGRKGGRKEGRKELREGKEGLGGREEGKKRGGKEGRKEGRERWKEEGWEGGREERRKEEATLFVFLYSCCLLIFSLQNMTRCLLKVRWVHSTRSVSVPCLKFYTYRAAA